MNKRQRVLELLSRKPMSLSDLSDATFPNITYTYLRSTLHKMTIEGLIEVVDTNKIYLDNGGYKEAFVYATTDLYTNDYSDQVKRKRLELFKQVMNKKGRPRKPRLDAKVLPKETRKELLLQGNPLFVMYSKELHAI